MAHKIPPLLSRITAHPASESASCSEISEMRPTRYDIIINKLGNSIEERIIYMFLPRCLCKTKRAVVANVNSEDLSNLFTHRPSSSINTRLLVVGMKIIAVGANVIYAKIFIRSYVSFCRFIAFRCCILLFYIASKAIISHYFTIIYPPTLRLGRIRTSVLW